MSLSNPPSDPKDEFDLQAPPQDDPDLEDGETVAVGGDTPREFSSEEERAEHEAGSARAREHIERNNEAIREREEGRRESEERATRQGEKIETREQGLWKDLTDRFGLGLRDSWSGKYMKFSPNPQKLEKQITAAILRQVFEKGNTRIYFYKDKYNIDLSTTSQAQSILAKLQAAKIVPAHVQISDKPMADFEPWLGPVGRAFRQQARNTQEKRETVAHNRKYGTDNRRFLGGPKGEYARDARRRFGELACPPKEDTAQTGRPTAEAAGDSPRDPGAAPDMETPETPFSADQQDGGAQGEEERETVGMPGSGPAGPGAAHP